MAAEKRLADALGGTDLVLFVKADASVGGYYVRKNILSVFGGEPFYVAAGVVASYVLVAGRQGDVLAAGVTPVHGGYVQASKAAEIVNAARPR